MVETIINENIKIRPVEKTDWDAVNLLCNKRFGEGYLDYEDFLFRASNPDMNLVADDDGKLVAFISMTPEDPQSLAETLDYNVEELLKDASGKKAIHFRTAVCDEAYEGKGIIRQMSEIAINNIDKNEYGLIMSSSWKVNNKVPARSFQQKLGFVFKGERHMLWYNKKGYKCLICKGPCKCDAELYEKIL